MLELDGSVAVPGVFRMWVPRDGLEAECEMVWRRCPGVGVKLVSGWTPQTSARNGAQRDVPIIIDSSRYSV